MKEILKLYTESGDFNNKTEIQNEIDLIKQSNYGTSFEVLAIYVTRLNNCNVLVEIQVPTLFSIAECGHTEIIMAAYSFDGELEDYSADNELSYKTFNEQWETAADQMRKLANEVATND
jgi:hypothetical protein